MNSRPGVGRAKRDTPGGGKGESNLVEPSAGREGGVGRAKVGGANPREGVGRAKGQG